jgi:hypothetical protein
VIVCGLGCCCESLARPLSTELLHQAIRSQDKVSRDVLQSHFAGPRGHSLPGKKKLMLENGCRDAPKRLGVAPLKEPQFGRNPEERRQKNESPV